MISCPIWMSIQFHSFKIKFWYKWGLFTGSGVYSQKCILMPRKRFIVIKHVFFLPHETFLMVHEYFLAKREKNLVVRQKNSCGKEKSFHFFGIRNHFCGSLIRLEEMRLRQLSQVNRGEVRFNREWWEEKRFSWLRFGHVTKNRFIVERHATTRES